MRADVVLTPDDSQLLIPGPMADRRAVVVVRWGVSESTDRLIERWAWALEPPTSAHENEHILYYFVVVCLGTVSCEFVAYLHSSWWKREVSSTCESYSGIWLQTYPRLGVQNLVPMQLMCSSGARLNWRRNNITGERGVS